AAPGGTDLEPEVDRLCAESAEAVEQGATLLVLSDRGVGRERAPIPSLLAVSAVHHHLVRAGLRLRAALVVDSGDPREVHHLACLIGYGADAVHPWLMLETAGGADDAVIESLDRGLLKTMSKMGISTVASYRGAQAFEAIGLDPDLVAAHFGETSSRVGGIGLADIGHHVLNRHRATYGGGESDLEPGGVYRWRRGGERHLWNPGTIVGLQRAVRDDGDGDDPRAAYRRYSKTANEDAARRGTLRGLLRFSQDQKPVPLDEVEAAPEIVKRFATGAMSLGSISPETHETLAIAMNRIGGKSNTGEGGEDARRFTPDDGGDLRRSAIKQVASARFGVTIDYLVNADELQIKVAQGSKPGEGGQLPGGKVDEYIGKLRHSTPGVELISPPPHHDIYSIEDLKQLIHDLRCANPEARISVKLASELGVGTVAAGVAKALSHHIVIAGHDGGTGASALSSIQSAGTPWELGLADTQQTLVRNDLRGRVVLQADGQMKTGRDVVVAALLGAEEMGFSTAPLISLGCIMMRVCHLNTCPVGIATQDPELRERFAGRPEHVARFFVMVAEEVREIIASLGVRRFHDLVGRVDLLEPDAAVAHWRARGLDLSALLAAPEAAAGVSRRAVPQPAPELDQPLDEALMAKLDGEGPVRSDLEITNVDRAVGGLLSGAIARRHGAAGLRKGSVSATFTGSAGQSFGAWLAPGVEFTLLGDANDYVGKGLSGGTLALTPDPRAGFRADRNVIAGNACLYGATEGRAFFRGLVGERFAVRNSGAVAVVEGVGDHGCEYMTGGTVLVLGVTGRNFAAGMSGGVAYVYDSGGFEERCNTELVGLEPIGAGDAPDLRALLAEHARRTGSPVASRILGRWEDEADAFVKVMPHDYRRALEEREAERAADAA
ncbi:MAG: glutamate synthase large chain, partial [Thermoleophilaceae bacterium]|nr:glutamate synthase large chain [Thermoleophilaceae bacterium]